VGTIYLKTEDEIKTMQKGGKILADILKKLAEAVKPGITTKDLDTLARELVLSYNLSGQEVKAGFLGYGGFPAALCASVNDEVVHGVPSKKILSEGDIISLDMGVIYEGFNLDSAITVPVLDAMSYKDWAKANPKLNELIEVTRESLNIAIKQAKAGNRIGKIGHAVQSFVEGKGFGVVRDLVGHGVGRSLHEDPQVPNFGSEKDGAELREGMVIAIEPMVTAGDWHVVEDRGGFTYRTKDGSYAAHFEHTVAITKRGPLVLTE
jgi:methionyl aminopeptidase